jgi:fatty-acyl-CoA synthase
VLGHWIDLARDVEASVVRVFGGKDGPGARAVGEALRAIAPLAESAGVTVALETHDAFCSAAVVADALDVAGSDRVAALWDTYHTFVDAGESPKEAARALHGRIAYVHIKDGRCAPDGSWHLTLPGEGDVPIEGTLEALRDVGYDGYLGVEWEKKWHPALDEPEVALPRHIAVLRALMAREA